MTEFNEIMKKAAYDLLDVWSDLQPMPYPIAEDVICQDKGDEDKSEYQKYLKLQEMTEKDRKEFFSKNSSWLIKNSTIKKYIGMCFVHYYHNKKRLEQLEELYQYIPTEDTVSLAMYEHKMERFKDEIKDKTQEIREAFHKET